MDKTGPDASKVFGAAKKPLAGLDKTKSLKPKWKIKEGTRGKDFLQTGFGLKQIARMTLGSGNMQLAVELPAGEDFNEWLAVNTIEFYNESKWF